MKIEMDEVSGWVAIVCALCLLAGWWSHTTSCETLSLSRAVECGRACGAGNILRVNQVECVCAAVPDGGVPNAR